MSDFKLKLILSVLGGVMFGFIFILLSFALPAKTKSNTLVKHPKTKLGIISQSLKK